MLKTASLKEITEFAIAYCQLSKAIQYAIAKAIGVLVR